MNNIHIEKTKDGWVVSHLTENIWPYGSVAYEWLYKNGEWGTCSPNYLGKYAHFDSLEEAQKILSSKNLKNKIVIRPIVKRSLLERFLAYFGVYL